MNKYVINILVPLLLTLLLSGCVETPLIKVNVPGRLSENNRPPQLASIANQTIPSLTPISVIDAGENGTDVDRDGDILTYACFYDAALDGVVAQTLNCSTITGITFSTTTGIMSWTPSAMQLGVYEFKIIATDGALFDEEIFSISVNNNNQAPVLDAIGDQTVSENVAITTVDAGVSAADVDIDGDALTYSCYFDTNINSSVATTTACSTLSGVSFNTATGVMDWTPSFSQSGSYEFIIAATDGSLSDTEIFSVTVSNVNRAPVLDSIADETVSEGVAITTVDAGDGSDDLDIDNQTITYSCYYDTVINGAVAATTSCSALTGVNFTAASGVMNWQPLLNQAGNYEFIITGSDGSLSDSEIFSITVSNTNQAPVLASISNQSVNENVAISSINANDGGDDLDADGEAITYSCYYDNVYDSAVASTNACSSLSGVTFTAATGAISWTPNYNQSGNYEFKIIGGDGSLTGDALFTITVAHVNRSPALDAIANQMIAYNTAMTTVNAGDVGDDFDADGDAITYSCFYDTTVNGTVAATDACTDLSGLTFSTTSGVMNWTPTSMQSGNYEFKVIGQDSSLSSGRTFSLSVTVTVPLAFVLRIAAPNTTIVLPVEAGGIYNFEANYGDGSALAQVTSFGDADNTHTYAAAGDYTVVLIGQLNKIRFGGNTNLKNSLIKVINLGDTGATELSFAFLNCTNLTEVAGGNTSAVTMMTSMFSGATKLVTADLSTFNTGNVTSMSNMFYNTPLLANLDISNFNTSNVTSMANMFSKTTALPSLDLSHFNTAKVNDMQGMFAESGIATLDVSNFNTTLVQDMSRMFTSASNLLSLNLNNFVTTNVTTMADMFQNCSKLATLDLQNFNTANVTNMRQMFSSTPELTSLDIGHFNTGQVTNMSSMFFGMTKLNYLDISNFNTINVTTMDSMFSGCRALTTLDLTHFNTANVTNMSSMFQTMMALTSLTLTNFNTSNVTNMSAMFSNTTALLALDLSMFTTPKVTDMTNMFNASKAPTLDLSTFDTTLVTNMSSMFRNSKATTIDLSSFNTTAVTNMSSMFLQATISSLDLSHFITSNVTTMASMFQGVNNLVSLNTTDWVLTAGASASTGVFTSANAGLVVTCNRGGAPATGTFFGKACN